MKYIRTETSPEGVSVGVRSFHKDTIRVIQADEMVPNEARSLFLDLEEAQKIASWLLDWLDNKPEDFVNK